MAEKHPSHDADQIGPMITRSFCINQFRYLTNSERARGKPLMSLLRKSLTTAAVAGVLLGGVFATPAAAADPNTCPKGKFCGWSGTNRTGTRTVYSEKPGCYPLDHVARSVSNQTSYTLVFWKATLGCATGTKLVTLKPGAYSDNPGSANSVEIYG